jgi:hypothetical protein
MERKESGAYLYVYVYLCVLHDSYVICMNDYDIMYVAAVSNLFKYQCLFTSITVMS